MLEVGGSCKTMGAVCRPIHQLTQFCPILSGVIFIECDRTCMILRYGHPDIGFRRSPGIIQLFVYPLRDGVAKALPSFARTAEAATSSRNPPCLQRRSIPFIHQSSHPKPVFQALADLEVVVCSLWFSCPLFCVLILSPITSRRIPIHLVFIALFKGSLLD